MNMKQEYMVCTLLSFCGFQIEIKKQKLLSISQSELFLKYTGPINTHGHWVSDSSHQLQITVKFTEWPVNFQIYCK